MHSKHRESPDSSDLHCFWHELKQTSNFWFWNTPLSYAATRLALIGTCIPFIITLFLAECLLSWGKTNAKQQKRTATCSRSESYCIQLLYSLYSSVWFLSEPESKSHKETLWRRDTDMWCQYYKIKCSWWRNHTAWKLFLRKLFVL